MPLFHFTHDTAILYQLAIIENALLGVIGFLLGIKLVKAVSPVCGNKIGVAISFVSIFYSAYLFQSQIGWSETCLYTWFLLVLWLCIRFLKKPGVMNSVIFSFSVGFLYVIHNRALPVIVAWAMLLIFLLLKKQISWRSALASVLTLAVVMAADHEMKTLLSQLMWGQSNGFRGNDIISQSRKFALFFSLDGLLTLFTSTIGKLWYLMVSTFLLAFWGMMSLVKKIWTALRKHTWDAQTDFYLFVMLCVLGVLATATIAMIPRDTQITYLFYGRYSDMITGILIILGVLYLKDECQHPHVWIETAIGIFIMVAAGVLVNKLSGSAAGSLNIPCVPGVIFSQSGFNAIKITFNAVILALMFVFSSCVIHRQFSCPHIRAIKFGILIFEFLLIVSAFYVIGENAYSRYLVPHQNWIRGNKGLYDFLNKYNDISVFVPVGKSGKGLHLSRKIGLNELVI